jgi:hypothetical protein
MGAGCRNRRSPRRRNSPRRRGLRRPSHRCRRPLQLGPAPRTDLRGLPAPLSRVRIGHAHPRLPH